MLSGLNYYDEIMVVRGGIEWLDCYLEFFGSSVEVLFEGKKIEVKEISLEIILIDE